MRKMLIRALLIVTIFSISGGHIVQVKASATGSDDIWNPVNKLGYGSERMFEWLATMQAREYVIGTFSKVPPFKEKTPSMVYFRGNGICEIVDLRPAEGVGAEITRGTWQMEDGKLVLMLTNLQTYKDGNVEEFALDEITAFEIADWEDIQFRVHLPGKRLFEGIATELKSEYLADRSWLNVPFVAGNNAPIEVILEEDGTYEFFCAEGMSFQGQTTEGSITEKGTWAIVENKLELTKIRHGVGDFTEELDPPIVQTYEITELQYMFDIPKEHVVPFLQCDGLMYLGEQLTMHIGDTQFWN